MAAAALWTKLVDDGAAEQEVTEAEITYVNVDPDGRPVPIPKKRPGRISTRNEELV